MASVAIIIIAAVVAIALGAFVWCQRRRTERLHSQFGPEYGRAIAEFGDRKKAEAKLERRQKRIEKFEIRPMSQEDQNRFAAAWRADQARFVDEPREAVARAHELVTEAMKARGYPVSTEFEQNAADLSVEHPRVVENYRLACGIMKRQESGEASTEDLRNAMVSYRTLFEELLDAHVNQIAEVRR